MKELFKNCIEVREINGWLVPVRFTQKQLDTYEKLSKAATIRSRCAASVMLAFKSAAKRLTFEYRITAKSREWAAFDTVCDGLLYSSVTVTEDSGKLEISLSGDENAETHIYLPHLVAIELRGISADAPLIPTAKKEKTWLALGDSITQGMVSLKPSFTYPVLLSELLGYGLINGGVGGIKFSADQLDHLGFEPDVITVALGCNDWGVEKEQLSTNVAEYIERLASIYKCRSIHLILPIWRSDENDIHAAMTFREHRDVIRRTAEKYSFVNIVDGYSLVPHMIDYFGDPSDVKIHPSDEGFLYYALSLISQGVFDRS